MKARSQELVEKSVSAMISAIEIYNKPDFKYREETFSILAINSWELLLKAKWLKNNRNQLRSLYVTEKRKKSDGSYYKYPAIKLTQCGNPFTHSLDFLAKKLTGQHQLHESALKNIDALREIRDSAVHFYNKNNLFAIRLQEVGSAAVKNFVKASQEWFAVDLSEYNFYLMPLAFVMPKTSISGLSLNKEEKNLANFISSLEAANDPNEDYAVSVNIEIKFSKSKANDALGVQITNDPNAPKFQFSEEQIQDKYPLQYNELVNKCREKYPAFIQNAEFNALLKLLKKDNKYSLTRYLNPKNLKSGSKTFYSHTIFKELDKKYGSKS